MQAWQQTKVINPDSKYVGRAGKIERVEKKGDDTLVFVKLDETANEDGTPKDAAEVTQFAPEELQVLGG